MNVQVGSVEGFLIFVKTVNGSGDEAGGEQGAYYWIAGFTGEKHLFDVVDLG